MHELARAFGIVTVLVAKVSSIPRPLLRPSTCRRSRPLNPSSPDFWSLCLRLRLCPRAARSATGRAGQWDRDTNPRTPAAPLAVDTLDPPRSALAPPPFVPPAVDHAAPPTSPGAGIVPLVADCLTQLSGGPIITPATISSPAAVPALQRLVSTPDA